MKLKLIALLAGCLACGSLSLHAQAGAAAPAGSTGVCNDGTFTNAASKSGACRGHKGVKSWNGATSAAPAAAAKPAATAPSTPAVAKTVAPTPPPARAAAPAAQPAPRSAASAPAASGGGNGQVWLNTADKVYHCQGDRFYGKTKAGAYMSEADAVSKGGKAAYGKTCSK